MIIVDMCLVRKGLQNFNWYTRNKCSKVNGPGMVCRLRRKTLALLALPLQLPVGSNGNVSHQYANYKEPPGILSSHARLSLSRV